MADLVTGPLGYPFMVRGLVTVVVVGLVCGTVGAFVVLRGMAFFSDALAHAVLPGIAVGYLASGGSSGGLFWWGMATAVVTAFLVGATARGTRLKEDTAVGIVFAGMFALGIAMMSVKGGFAIDITHLLFGNVLGVSGADLLRTASVAAIVIATIGLLYKELVLVSFDPLLATTLRLPERRLTYLLLVLVAVTIILALQTVGIALTLAMLVTPPASAMLLTRRLPAMIGLGAAIGAMSGVAGLYISFYARVAPGPAIVLVATAVFGAVAAIARWRPAEAPRTAEPPA